MIRTRQSRRMAVVEIVTQKAVVAAFLMPSGIIFLGLEMFESAGFTAFSMIVSFGLSWVNRRVFDRMPVIIRYIKRRYHVRAS